MKIRILCHCVCLAVVSAITAHGEGAWEIDARVVDRSHGSVTTSDVPVLFTRRYLKIGLPAYNRGKSDLLHDHQTGSCRLVSHAQKSYVQINTRAVAAVGDAARTIGGAIREGVGKITGRAPVAGPALKVSRSEKTQVIGGMPCHHFTVRHGGTVVQEIWATAWQHAGIAKRDVGALRELAAAMDQRALTSLLGLATGGTYSLTASLLQIDGYPVIFIQYEKGKPACHIRMGKPKRTNVSADTFRCPASYRLKLPPMS